MQFSFIHNNKGTIGLLTTLVVGAVVVMLALTIVLTGLSARTNAFTLNQSEKVFISTEGCIEEALIRLNRDHDYIGGTDMIGGVACTSVINGADPNRAISVSGIKDNITRDVFLQVRIVPDFAIISWTD